MHVKLKKSTTSGNVPTTSALEQGEVAINVPDGLIFMKRVNGSEKVVTFRPWTGDFQTLGADEATFYVTLLGVKTCLTITLAAAENYIEFAGGENGFVGKLIVNEGKVGSKLKVDVSTGILNEVDAVSYQEFGYSAQTISEITGNAQATLRTATAHGYAVGDRVNVAGFSGDKATYNGVHAITEIVDSQTFIIDVDYEASGSSSSPTVQKYELCYNINSISMFEIIKDSSNIYIRKLGDFA